MSNFNEFLAEQMKDPEFKAEWDALDPEFTVIEAILKARKESGLTQKQLSERTGIAQTDISKLERGNANPSLRTLQRLAAGMGMKIKLEFVPVSAKKIWFLPAAPTPGLLFVAAGSVVVVALDSAVVITVILRIINADVSLG